MSAEPHLARAIELLVAYQFPRAAPEAQAALVAEHTPALETRQHFARTQHGDAGLVVAGSMASRGWIVGLTRHSDNARELLSALEHQARALGPGAKLRIGGPPGSYLISGIDARDSDALEWFTRAGYAEERRHVDFRARLHAPAAMDPRLRRCRPDERAALCTWVESHFAHAWREEVERALVQHIAVIVSGEPGAYVGFAAHSGNNAALGTFGPVGVLEGTRRSGLGGALARAALDDLASRGFEHVTIPWVDPMLEGFYRKLVVELARIDRVVLAKTLAD